MKLSHKTLVAGAVIAFAVMGTAFAEGEFTFENKISTNTYNFGDYDGNYRLPSIRETMKGEYLSDKFDTKVDLSFWLFRYNDDTDENSQMAFNGFNFGETYIKFRPVEAFQIALATDEAEEKTAGSYLPVLDDNIRFGYYTGNFGLLFKPIESLSIGAGIDFYNGYGFLYNDFDDNADKIYLNFGAEYALENIGDFAITFNNVLNNFSFGAFAKISAITDTNFYVGFSYQNDFDSLLSVPNLVLHTPTLRGKTLFNAGVEYRGVDKLTLAADIATNLFVNADAYYDGTYYYSTYDLYTGFKVAYDINDSFTISCENFMTFDFVDSKNDEYNNFCGSPAISIYPEVSYKMGNHTFKAGLRMEFYHRYEIPRAINRESNFGMCIPLSWTYSF